MKITKDTFTGKPFRWNTTNVYVGYTVPARCTAQVSTCLHPSRVPTPLLRKLNPNKPVPWQADVESAA